MIGVAEQARLIMLGPDIQYEPNPLSGIDHPHRRHQGHRVGPSRIV